MSSIQELLSPEQTQGIVPINVIKDSFDFSKFKHSFMTQRTIRYILWDARGFV